MIIQFDDREPASTEAFALLVDEKLVMLRTRLDVGDYIWNDVVIERKEINDFCQSIMDGRIESQVERMKEKFDNVYFIIIGRIKDRTSEIHEHSVLGMVISLIMKHKVGVIMVDDEFQFMYAMKRIYERHKEMDDMELTNKMLEEMKDES